MGTMMEESVGSLDYEKNVKNVSNIMAHYNNYIEVRHF